MPDEMTMVGRVAKALHEKLCQQDVLGYLSATIDCEELAKAAIEAMREPMSGMVEVGTEARWQSAVLDANSVREIWTAMVDAALKEPE